jgi:ubiquinone/menaquinone biosynthesis C-methylase UbiE
MENETNYYLVNKYYPEYKNIYEEFENILLPCCKPGMVLLDAGCGAGNPIVLKCLKKNIKIIGVDNDIDALKNNSTYHETKLIDIDNQSLPFAANTFDIITSVFVMEHLKNPEKSLAEFARTIRKGGALILVFPNLYNPLMFGTRITPFCLHKLYHWIFTGTKRPYLTYFKCNTVKKIDKKLSNLGFKRETLVLRGEWGVWRKIKLFFLIWIFLDKITNAPILRITKSDILVLYRKMT